MKMLALLILPLLAESSPADPRGNVVDGPHPHSDSGIIYPPYETLFYEFNRVAEKFPDLAQVVIYGKSRGGRDLFLMKIESRGAARPLSPRPAVEISGVIHGNEYLGIEDKLPRHLLEKPLPGFTTFIASGGVIYIAPVLNPDGFAQRRRYNDNDVDLNRDFDVVPLGQDKLTEPETKAFGRYLLSDLTSNRLKLEFSLDYHCCVPALVTPWNFKNSYPTQADLARYNEISELQRRTLGLPVGNALDTVGYLAHGTSTDYFYGKYGAAAFTVEGSHGGEAKRFAQHVQFIDAVLDRLVR